MHEDAPPGYVILEDGTVFEGTGFACEGAVFGEIVFNTGMTGYQEVVTDPSYHGQMVVFTYPLIGNYGVSESHMESDRVWAKAVVTREAKNTSYNRTCPGAWVDWLASQGVVGVAGVDTRALTRRIREQGAMTACVAAGRDVDVESLIKATRDYPALSGRDLVREATSAAPYRLGPENDASVRAHVVAIDYGIKRSILRQLLAAGVCVTVVPAFFTADEILAYNPDGVLLSNGPGDPAPLDYAIATVRSLLDRVPVLGICLGHQLLALAVGLSTYKLRFGHRGVNHPVKVYRDDRVEITSQNHGFAVEPPPVVSMVLAQEGDISAISPDELSVETDAGKAWITHLNLNDGTVEGLELAEVDAFSVQYHPEAGPGPHDSRPLFNRFVERIARS